jgi:hypothetical protein
MILGWMIAAGTDPARGIVVALALLLGYGYLSKTLEHWWYIAVLS